jgi:hypothetical protein
VLNFLRRPLDDVSRCMEQLIDAPRPVTAMALAFASMALTWFIYVPIHELLHVAGCLATGGSVSELEIQPEYGGHLLARVFDFVVVGGEYSGRLSGFDTHGSDFTYFATDIGPYLLSIFIGVPLLQLCTRARRPLLFGPAIVIGLAPFYNFIGDYYEMASTLVTRLVTLFRGGGNPPAFESLRSDDVLSLISRFADSPAELGLETSADVMAGAVIVGASIIGSIALAFATYLLGVYFADAVLPPAPAAAAGEADE